MIQNIRGPKLSWLGHQGSIRGKTFVFTAKQHPQVPKHFEICRKTFVVQAKTAKTKKSFGPQMFYTIQY